MGPRLEHVKSFSRRFGSTRRAHPRRIEDEDPFESHENDLTESGNHFKNSNSGSNSIFGPYTTDPPSPPGTGGTKAVDDTMDPNKKPPNAAPSYNPIHNTYQGGPSGHVGDSWTNPIDLTAPPTAPSNPSPADFQNSYPHPFFYTWVPKPAHPMPNLPYIQPPHTAPQTPQPNSSKWTQSGKPFMLPPQNDPSKKPPSKGSVTFADWDAADWGTDEFEWYGQDGYLAQDEELAWRLQLEMDEEAGKQAAAMGLANIGQLGYEGPLASKNTLPFGYTLDVQPSNSNNMEVDDDLPAASTSLDVSDDDEESNANMSEEEQMILEQLKQYVGSLSIPCASCGKIANLKRDDIPSMTRKWVANSGRILCGLQCSGSGFCSTTTCPGCRTAIKTEGASLGFGAPPSTPPSYQSVQVKVGVVNFTVYYCCEGGREFALWALACGWDQIPTTSWTQAMVKKLRPSKTQSIQSKAASTSSKPFDYTTDVLNNPVASKHPAPNNHRERLLRRTPVTARGTGYGGHDSWGYFPFMHVGHRRHRQVQPPIVPKPTNTKEDFVQEAYFRLVAVLLPSLNAIDPQNMDITPPTYLHSVLARSPLMVRAAGMLNNDSVEDITKQHSLYDGMLDFVNALGDHTTTAGLIYNERQMFTKWGSTLAVSFKKEDNKAKKITPKDSSKPLVALLSRLASQSKILQSYAAKNPSEFTNKAETDMLLWASRVVQISALHEVNLQQRTADAMDIDSGKGKKPASYNWTDYHREHALKDMDDERILHNHYFERSAVTTNGVPPKGRMKRLITEISTLQTSLPVGIFVRHGSSRLDVMRVMIIGPKDTPYEYGLFEFDLFCPLDYPASPPKMQFKTTGNGKIRFNPNLYEDGKVCLSLLGTWAGEPWRPEQSTLLQILVSIQSMIFCEEPWYNEPGRELTETKTQSLAYNDEVRSWTAQYAIYPWVSAISATTVNPENSLQASSWWRPLAQTHLRLFGRDIEGAMSKAVQNSNTATLGHSVKSLRAALQKQGYLA